MSNGTLGAQEKIYEISARAKDFFILSSGYFVPEGGSVSLLLDMETLSEPKLISGTQLSIQVFKSSVQIICATGTTFKTNGTNLKLLLSDTEALSEQQRNHQVSILLQMPSLEDLMTLVQLVQIDLGQETICT